MSYEDNNAGSEQPAKRRPWDAPRIVTVVPVDRTQGGPTLRAAEISDYRAS